MSNVVLTNLLYDQIMTLPLTRKKKRLTAISNGRAHLKNWTFGIRWWQNWVKNPKQHKKRNLNLKNKKNCFHELTFGQ